MLRTLGENIGSFCVFRVRQLALRRHHAAEVFLPLAGSPWVADPVRYGLSAAIGALRPLGDGVLSAALPPALCLTLLAACADAPTMSAPTSDPSTAGTGSETSSPERPSVAPPSTHPPAEATNPDPPVDAVPTTPEADLEGATTDDSDGIDEDAGLPADPLGTAGNVAGAPVETDDPFSTDRSAFGGASRCGGLTVLFCDGFEAKEIGPQWQKQGPGTTELTGEPHFRGERALHVHTEGNGYALLRLKAIFPLPHDTYWGRMFVRFDALPTAPRWAHWTIAEAAGLGDGSLIRIGGQFDGRHNRFGVGTDAGPTGDWTRLDEDPGSESALPEDQWLCVEWLHDGEADVTRFYWDGDERGSLATTSSDHGGDEVPYVMPEFQAVWVGWWLYQPDPNPNTYDVWIDEVAFDQARIGCVR